MVNIYIALIKWTSTKFLTNMELDHMWRTTPQPPSTQEVNNKTHLFTLTSKYGITFAII